MSDGVRLPLGARFALAGFLAEHGVKTLTIVNANDEPLATLTARQTDLPGELARLPERHSIAWQGTPEGRVMADAGGLLVRCQDSATLSEIARVCERDA